MIFCSATSFLLVNAKMTTKTTYKSKRKMFSVLRLGSRCELSDRPAGLHAPLQRWRLRLVHGVYKRIADVELRRPGWGQRRGPRTPAHQQFLATRAGQDRLFVTQESVQGKGQTTLKNKLHSRYWVCLFVFTSFWKNKAWCSFSVCFSISQLYQGRQ